MKRLQRTVEIYWGGWQFRIAINMGIGGKLGRD